MTLAKRQGGQAILEYVLLLSIVFSVWIGVTKIMRDEGVFQKVFGDPWARLSNVLEFGVPANDRRQASQADPTNWARHATRLRP